VKIWRLFGAYAIKNRPFLLVAARSRKRRKPL